jgi:hypothetical protein
MYIAIANAIYSSTLQGSGGGFPIPSFRLNYNTIASDFTFTRNSFATRVNEFGLIETVTDLGLDLVQNGSFDELGSDLIENGDFDELGSELVVNGDFEDGENDWNFGGDWTLVNGTAEILTSTQSYLRSDNDRVPLTVKTYKLQYEVVTTNGSNIRLAGGSSAFGTVTLDSSTVGVKTAYITSNGTQTYLQINQNAFRGSIDNISLKQVDPNDDWLKLNSTISDGKGNLDGDGQTSLLYQDILTNGKSYKVTFTISDYNGLGDASLINNGGASIFNITSNGTFTIYFKHSNASGNFLFRAISGAIYSIDNVSVKQVDPNDYWEQFGVGITITDKANFDGSGTTVNFRQVGVVTAAKTYKVTYTVGDYSQGSLSMRVGGTYGTARTANGTYTDTLTAANGNFQIYGFSNFIGSIDNIIVKEVLEDDIPRIDYTGSTFDVPVYGDELLTDAVISNNGGGSFTFTANGVRGVSDGTSGSTLRPRLLWSSLTVGKQYRIIGIPTVNSGTTDYSIYNGSSYEKDKVAVESFDITFTCNSSNVFFTNDGEQVFDINWDLSIKEVTAYTTTDKGAFLLEPISTNLIIYSEDFTNNDWSELGASGAFVSGEAPDGNTSVYELTSDGGGGKLQKTISGLAINTGYTLSFYVKQTSPTTLVQSRVLSQTGGSGGSNLISVNYQDQLVTDEWVRITHTFTTNDTLGNYIIYLSNALTSGESLQFFAAQLELLPYATSYIPTSGTTVTRAQESCQKANLSTDGLFGGKEGTIFLNTTDMVTASTSLNSFTPFRLYRQLIDKYRFYYEPDAAFIGGNIDLSANGGELKMAFSVSDTEITIYVNGSLHATHTIVNPMASDLETWVWSTETKYKERVKDFRIYNKPLTDEQLTELTTI